VIVAYTQADLDRLRAIRASGAKSVTFSDGRAVVYNTPAELDAAISLIEADLTQSESGRSTYASFSRG
jgi:hypothetical protein